MGIPKQFETTYGKHKGKVCERCGFIAVHSCQLDVHHIDGIHGNDDLKNLQTLCANCHRLVTHEARAEHTARRRQHAKVEKKLNKIRSQAWRRKVTLWRPKDIL
jgi:predicted HNH restriction endonuclease